MNDLRPVAALRTVRNCLLVWVMFSAIVDVDALQASNPRLNLILPRGVQRGHQYTLRMNGERIGDAQQILLYDSGMSVAEIKPVDGNNIDVVVDVAADCRVGEHVLQIRTPRGLSDYRSVFVGHLPAVDEVEPNSTMDTRQVVEMNHTISGTITNEDIDYFAVTVKKGERISAEIEAIRLGFMFDPFVAILDENRFELAVSDDTPLFNQDAFVSVVAPEDGTYTILVRETSYGGNANCRYRLHVGNFPRPTAVFPAGGPLGQPIDLTFLGDPTGPIALSQMTLPAQEGFRPGLFLDTAEGSTPSPFPFRFNDLPNHLELEPNDTWVTEPVLSLPIAINGIVEKPADMDYYLFEAKQGQVWEFECYGKRIGSGLDPVMNIFKADKTHVVSNDDSRGPDSYIRFSVPEDGQYYVRIYDHLNRGQPDFVYRLEVSPVTPALAISIPRVDRYSQQRQTICVPQGNRFATLITGTRENVGGELKLLEDNLPPGIKMTAMPMAGNLNSMPVVFEAAPDAELLGQLVDFRVKINDENNPLTGGFSNLADFANGEPNNALYYGCSVDRLAMAVTQSAPFHIDIVQPQAPLVRDGTYNLRVVVRREEGFDGPINLQFPFRPPGVGTTNQIQIPAGQTEITYPLNANANAQLGKWPVYVIGNAAVDGGALWVSSQLAELTVADPYVRIEVPRAGCDQGQSAQLIAKFEQLAEFEGEGTITLLGLPPTLSAEPQKFTKDTTELVFTLPTTEASPLGNHKSLFCQLEIPIAGEPVISATGRTELQINKPAPVAVAPPPPAPSAEPAAEAAPPPKPLSRLEQLRQRFRETSGGQPPPKEE